MNSKQKGNRAERELCKIFNERFHHLAEQFGGFSRSVGSGNRWAHKVILSKAAADTYSGDITCPEGFRFTLESKCGYPALELGRIVEGPIGLLDDFLGQAEKDSQITGKRPALIIKQSRRDPVVFIKTHDLGPFVGNRLQYGDWSGISLKTWLGLPDGYFFSYSKP